MVGSFGVTAAAFGGLCALGVPSAWMQEIFLKLEGALERERAAAELEYVAGFREVAGKNRFASLSTGTLRSRPTQPAPTCRTYPSRTYNVVTAM